MDMDIGGMVDSQLNVIKHCTPSFGAIPSIEFGKHIGIRTGCVYSPKRAGNAYSHREPSQPGKTRSGLHLEVNKFFGGQVLYRTRRR